MEDGLTVAYCRYTVGIFCEIKSGLILCLNSFVVPVRVCSTVLNATEKCLQQSLVVAQKHLSTSLSCHSRPSYLKTIMTLY